MADACGGRAYIAGRIGHVATMRHNLVLSDQHTPARAHLK